MVSLARRYESGDHEGVWAEIRRSGPLPSAAQPDVDAVAAATMRRALPQLERIAEQATALGFTPGIDAIPILDPPGDDAPARLAALVGAIGPLPAALVAQMSVIGGVSLVGDCSALGLSYANTTSAPPQGMPPGADYPDPLWLPSAHTLASDWEDWASEPDRRAEPFTFALAPDELHKANISGGTHDVGLPDPSADPILHGVAGRPGITLVEYLRVSVAWGGLPGYAFEPHRTPPALSRLRAQPRF